MSSQEIITTASQPPETAGLWIWLVVILIIVILAIAIIIIMIYFRRPMAPPPPTNLRGMTGGTNTLTLSWLAPLRIQPAGYMVFFDTNPSLVTAMIGTVPPNNTSFSVQVAPGTYYMSVATQATFTGQVVTGPIATPIAGPLVIPHPPLQ